jgi:general secretion pathway protein A
MLLDYYKLAEPAFGDTPDTRFLYLGAKHREALASLVYGTESNRGFLALIAKPGMGKTSLLYQYLEGMRSTARTAFVFQTDCDSREFLRHILLDLEVDASGKDLPAMHDLLNRLLMQEMRRGRRFILVIDEAQNLEERVLESVRLLSNFETPWAKLMQIVLAGQPQLAKKLARPSLLQLRQRLSMVIRIEPFTFEETRAYIHHRLAAAGYHGQSLFTVGARRLIAEQSGGIPRNINNICFNAMSLGYALEQKTIDENIVLEALKDLDLDGLNSQTLDESDLNVHNRPHGESRGGSGKPSMLGSWWRKVAAASFFLIFTLSWPASLNGSGRSSSPGTAGLQAERRIHHSITQVSATHALATAHPASQTVPVKAGTP